jgi:uncharacterized membrane protein YhaH (DUF805 family)
MARDGYWTEHQNIDMCFQGDVEILEGAIVKDIPKLKKIVEEKNYSAVCVGSFPHAALKKFDYQLTAEHCKPSKGYTNTLYIWHRTGSASGKERESQRAEEYKKWKDGDHRTVDGKSHGHSSTAKQSDALYDDDSETPEGITWMLFSYDGRMGRKKFFMASILALIIFWSLLVILWLVILDWNTFEGFLVSVLILAPLGLWMQSATVVKRLKDNGDDPRAAIGYCLLPLMPYLGYPLQFLWWMSLVLKKGDQGPNKFGADPRDISVYDNY